MAASLQNSPTNAAFTLKVEFSSGVAYPCQLIREFHTGRIYYRFWNGTEWGTWMATVLNNDLEIYVKAIRLVGMGHSDGKLYVPYIFPKNHTKPPAINVIGFSVDGFMSQEEGICTIGDINEGYVYFVIKKYNVNATAGYSYPVVIYFSVFN